MWCKLHLKTTNPLFRNNWWNFCLNEDFIYFLEAHYSGIYIVVVVKLYYNCIIKRGGFVNTSTFGLGCYESE